MNKDEELKAAYDERDALAMKADNLRGQLNEMYRVQQIIIAAGLLDQEKFDQARELAQL